MFGLISRCLDLWVQAEVVRNSFYLLRLGQNGRVCAKTSLGSLSKESAGKGYSREERTI